MVQSELESETRGEETQLTAEIAHGVDVGIDIGVDPGDPRAESNTLSTNWRSRGQQTRQREDRDGGLARPGRVNESHRRPPCLTCSQQIAGGWKAFLFLSERHARNFTAVRKALSIA